MIPPTQGSGAIVLAVVAILGFGAFFFRTWKLYRYLRLGWNEDRRAQLWSRLKDELVIYIPPSGVIPVFSFLKCKH